MLHHAPLVDETYHMSSMANLPHATRITILLREVNRNDHYLCSSCLQTLNSADLIYEKMTGIVNRLCNSFRFGSLEENRFRYLIFILCLRSLCHTEIRFRLLSLLDNKPDDIHRPRGTIPIQRIAEAITPEMRILRGTLLSLRLPYRRHCSQNCNENGYKEGFCRESSTNSSTRKKLNNKRSVNSDGTELWYIKTLIPISNAMLLDAMQGYISGEDYLQGVLRCRLKYQPHGPRLDRCVQPYSVLRRILNLPDTYS
ncbi:hypothetical protein ACTXT7_007897 [Hymenolepis weldensis]